MMKAKTDLKTAVDKAAGTDSAVGVEPSLKAGHPIAAVVLVKSGALRTVSRPLD
jgi:hypothetical protein